MSTLVLSKRTHGDNQRLWREAVRRRWTIARCQGVDAPAIDRDEPVALYLEPLVAPTVAAKLGVELLDPTPAFLTRLRDVDVRRGIRLATVGEARSLGEAAFVKPPNDKSFEAAVYSQSDPLPDFLDQSEPVLIADPVEFEVEYRGFVLDRRLLTLSPYIRFGRLSIHDDYMSPDSERKAATRFLQRFLAESEVELPRGVVVDVGRLTDGNWAVIEANGAWGAGLYGCRTTDALDVIAASCRRY